MSLPIFPLRHLPARVRRSAAIGRLSPRKLYLDPLATTKRASVVLGTGRSGTTKLAELLCSRAGTRLIFEPLHTSESPLAPPTFVWGEYVEPWAERDDLAGAWSAVLRGRVHEERLDHLNRARFVKHRVVKSIAATNLCGWLRTWYRDVGIVYIVRHPFAVATSLLSLDDLDTERGRPGGWRHSTQRVSESHLMRLGLLQGPLAHRADQVLAACRDAEDRFDRIVVHWCLQNAATLDDPPSGVHLVYFERVFSDPEGLGAVADHLGLELADDVQAQVSRPSATDFRTGGDRRIEARVGNWVKDLEPERRRAGLRILEQFGLRGFYDDGPLPLPPDQPRLP